MSYTCKYCKNEFKRETSLAVHVCEQKRRYQEQREQGVQLGLHAYLRFYEVTQGSAKLKTFDTFAESPYYRAFVKFGRYCVGINAISPLRLTEWLLKHNKKIDHWCRDSVYTEYLLDHLKVEAVDDALTRAIEYSIKWSDENSCPANDCLRFGNTNILVYAITAGRISPWVIYNCESGTKFLESLNTEQISTTWPYIDADVWQRKFKTYPADVEYCKDILTKAGW